MLKLFKKFESKRQMLRRVTTKIPFHKLPGACRITRCTIVTLGYENTGFGLTLYDLSRARTVLSFKNEKVSSTKRRLKKMRFDDVKIKSVIAQF